MADEGNKVRTLIVDDSAMVRRILRSALSQHPRIEVVGEAVDGVEGIRKIARLRPDVVTLDVEMPRLNGIGVLERVVGKVPISFVMVSTLTQAGARITFEALDKGAFDFVAKPKSGGFAGLPEFRELLHEKVLGAAKCKGRREYLARTTKGSTAVPSLPPNKQKGWVVAIGISCGGPQTLIKMMPAFPSDFVPILITQHMPAEFTASFAKHLGDASNLVVREAVHMDRPEPGTALVAPGGQHMKLVRSGTSLVVHLDDGPKVSRHRPSVDVLFDSVAKCCGSRAVGVIMTGMGDDGAAGITRLRQAGAWTIGQDEESSLVYGMPQVADKAGGLDHVVSLQKIPLAVSKLLNRGVKKVATTAR